jgi:hypothetical protein
MGLEEAQGSGLLRQKEMKVRQRGHVVPHPIFLGRLLFACHHTAMATLMLLLLCWWLEKLTSQFA